MKQLLSTLAAGVAALNITASAVAGISISLEPAHQTINVGDPVTIELVVSGLGNLSAPSLGAFEFDLTYNPAVISVVSLTFGSFLDLGNLGSIQFSDLSTAGFIHLDEVSFEDVGDLNNVQPDLIRLATLDFKGLAAGNGGIEFSFVSLSDEQGQSLVGWATTSGSIRVEGSAVPEVASKAPLVLMGIVCLRASRRRAWTKAEASAWPSHSP